MNAKKREYIEKMHGRFKGQNLLKALATEKAFERNVCNLRFKIKKPA